MIDKNHLIRMLGGLALLGGMTAVPLMIAFAQTSWGRPGSFAYQTYEMLNRHMALSLLLMTAGWLGVVLWLPRSFGRLAVVVAFLSSLLMVVGVAAEFWLFTDLPYRQINMRSTAFLLFSLSSLALDFSASILGVSLWHSRLWSRRLAFILLLALPIDLAAFFWLESIFLAATILALVVGVNLIRIKPIYVEIETPVT